MTAKQIAIDGPAGAGKSTVAKLVADRLSYLYIDTGAMYRAVALAAMREGITADQEASLVELAQRIDLRLLPASGGCRVFIGEDEVSKEIRLPEVGQMASPVSAIAELREEMVRRQRQLAADNCVVMDGRDIGSVVLPQAECKIYLTADLHTRAQRRAEELLAKGQQVDIAQIEREMAERDYRDSHRSASPLRQVEDAHLVDSSYLTIDDVVNCILELAEGTTATPTAPKPCVDPYPYDQLEEATDADAPFIPSELA